MPINLPNGANVEQIVLPNGAQASEVYGPTGQLVWEGDSTEDSGEIPDNGLQHRHIASELSLSNGDPVNTWPDVIGDGDLTGGVDANTPTFVSSGIGDQPSVDFDEANFKNDAIAETIGGGDYTIVFIAEPPSLDPTGEDRSYLVDIDGGGDRGIHSMGDDSTEGIIAYNDGNWQSVTSDTFAADDANIAVWRRGGTTLTGGINGNRESISISIQDHSDGTVSIGQREDGSKTDDSWHKWMAEILVYDRAITDSEWDELESYAADNYGVSLSQ